MTANPVTSHTGLPNAKHPNRHAFNPHIAIISALSYRVKLIKDLHQVLLQLYSNLFALRRQAEKKKYITATSLLEASTICPFSWMSFCSLLVIKKLT